MTVLDRKLITRMVNPQPGGNGGGGGAGGAGAYVLPAASNSELGGIKLGYPTGTGKFYPVQLDNQQRAYVNVPWTDHYAWGDITGKPNFATVATSGSYNDLSNKPSIPSVSGNVSGSTMTITINGTAYSLTDTNTWRPIGTGATDAAAGNHLHDDRYLKLTGGTMSGAITFSHYGTTINFAGGESLDGYGNFFFGNNSQTWSVLNGNSHLLIVQKSTGNVGIGTDSPSYKLHVAGTIYATGSITERSDIRCKDVETYQWSPTLDMIADAPIIRYTMKDDKTHRMRVGSVAQYWEKVMPETVSKDNEGILSIAQGDICMVNIIALAREVRKLREEVKLLRNGRN